MQQESVPVRGPRPVLSVVVVAPGAERTVLRSVGSLLAQDFDEPMEVVVVTSGDDRSGMLVRERNPEVTVIETAVGLLPGAARNLGAAAARGDFVAFLPGDALARGGWARDRVALHRAGHDAVAGAVAPAEPGTVASRAAVVLRSGDRGEGGGAGPAGPSRSCGLSFTRQLLERAGPFDETLVMGEEALMVRRLAALGVTPWFAPSVCDELMGPARLRQLVEEEAARGRRRARDDVVTSGVGSAHAWIEERSVTLAVGLRAARRGLTSGRALVENLGQHRSEGPGTLRVASVALAGLLAENWGWAEEQAAYAHRGAFRDTSGTGRAGGALRRRTGTTGERTLVLTFDDGPSAATPDVLRVLRAHDVPAVFFVLGARAEAEPDTVRAIAAAGHRLAIHGWRHTAFTELGADTVRAEVARTQALLSDLTGIECRDVRPPYGTYDGSVVACLAAEGFVTWLWTADGRDYEPGVGVPQIVRTTLGSLTPGGIVLLHDGGGDRTRTVQALPAIIEGARARGFRFVSLDECGHGHEVAAG